MNTGMLWFDNDPKTALAAKIERAVDYYHKKYGCRPNLCLIHPIALDTEQPKTGKTCPEQPGRSDRPPLSTGVARSPVDRYRRKDLAGQII